MKKTAAWVVVFLPMAVILGFTACGGGSSPSIADKVARDEAATRLDGNGYVSGGHGKAKAVTALMAPRALPAETVAGDVASGASAAVSGFVPQPLNTASAGRKVVRN